MNIQETRIEPEVDMGVTLQIGSDRYPYTVVEVSKSKRQLVIQEDDYVRLDRNGQSESQEYDFRRNPNGKKVKISLRKDGCWRDVGYGKRSGGVYFVGRRSKYLDPSF